MRALPLLALSVALIGCAPKVSMQVLEPADVSLPQHIQTIAVVDRSKADTAGEKVLSVVEGLLTQEDPFADRAGREAAMNQVAQTLTASPRYESVFVVEDPDLVDSSWGDETLRWQRADKLCEQYGCDAVVALEAFDSDSSYSHSVEHKTVERDGREVNVKVHHVSRDTGVVTAWRVYDVHRDRIVDDLYDFGSRHTWNEQGDTESEAEAKLPSQASAVRDVGRDSGEAYARRIAPSYVTVTRRFFARGADGLKEAKPYAKARDWDAAARLWLELVDDPDPKVAGRATYNLAIVHEVRGEMGKAVSMARDAAVALDNNRSRSYVYELEQRIRDQERLEEQMGDKPVP